MVKLQLFKATCFRLVLHRKYVFLLIQYITENTDRIYELKLKKVNVNLCTTI